jgi:hypothetical protein
MPTELLVQIGGSWKYRNGRCREENELANSRTIAVAENAWQTGIPTRIRPAYGLHGGLPRRTAAASGAKKYNSASGSGRTTSSAMTSLFQYKFRAPDMDCGTRCSYLRA